MTDDLSSRSNPRIDFRALGAGPVVERDEATIATVMARIAADRAGAADDITRLLRARRRLAAAAAALAGLAATAMLALPRDPAPAPAGDPISRWVESSHVPTNGELLAAFRGYPP